MQARHLLGERQVFERRKTRQPRKRVETRLQTVQHTGWPAGHLGTDLDTFATRLFGNAQHLVVHVRGRRGRDQGNRASGFPGELLDPGPLVVAAQVIRNQLEDAMLEPLHGQPEGQHLVTASEGARHVNAVFIAMQEGT